MAKLILTHEVTGLGEPGDVVEVKDGYARNFLVPRKLATPWSRDSLQSKPVVVEAKAGAAGRLFGAVTTADIASAVTAAGASVDKRKIEIGQPIKATGDYTVSVRLHPEVSATLAVKVVAA
ncbi:MAG: ribosomal protein [Cellulosimicrobium sp.]|nr:ribosomal protein [Cellulosimicrobium sp.]